MFVRVHAGGQRQKEGQSGSHGMMDGTRAMYTPLEHILIDQTLDTDCKRVCLSVAVKWKGR